MYTKIKIIIYMNMEFKNQAASKTDKPKKEVSPKVLALINKFKTPALTTLAALSLALPSMATEKLSHNGEGAPMDGPYAEEVSDASINPMSQVEPGKAQTPDGLQIPPGPDSELYHTGPDGIKYPISYE
jgi:hypothetical protein